MSVSLGSFIPEIRRQIENIQIELRRKYPANILWHIQQYTNSTYKQLLIL